MRDVQQWKWAVFLVKGWESGPDTGSSEWGWIFTGTSPLLGSWGGNPTRPFWSKLLPPVLIFVLLQADLHHFPDDQRFPPCSAPMKAKRLPSLPVWTDIKSQITRTCREFCDAPAHFSILHSAFRASWFWLSDLEMLFWTFSSSRWFSIQSSHKML